MKRYFPAPAAALAASAMMVFSSPLTATAVDQGPVTSKVATTGTLDRKSVV